ncbi:hypothetical protein BD324DRAFT_263253 [Kockovaella imperatae]|uniref:Uncharacterized protein n=1 Tax=Kockovaella imperatae TaxID=4999 RepID=A0A1Y1UQ92_9TREE|nr:hypothetical protein BD324DRAFT_263253 [Kockovaella imperatae]ORX40169.1 hypothetical protein BD324DRAFT_263253 [Kockovaella imperatae]
MYASDNAPQAGGRAKKVAAAREKLNAFRASRSSGSSASSYSSSSPNLSSQPSFPDPLTTDITANILGKSGDRGPPCENAEDEEHTRLKKPRSRGSLTTDHRRRLSGHTRTHSRQLSSVSGNTTSFGLARGNVIDLFDHALTFGSDLPPFPTGSSSEQTVPTPVTPVFSDGIDAFPPNSSDEDRGAVKDRLSSFSFGAKPPAHALRSLSSPQPPPSVRRLASPSASPSSSPTRPLTTPSAHGPSLLLTRPTPLASSLSPSMGTSRSEGPLSPSSTPARSRRHSHTRSSSISLPNLKLASRPPSLGIPSSPSFPTSPASPNTLIRSQPNPNIQGTRLKFEPSGRGAEAEKEKEDYRRKALEKLTGSPVIPDEPASVFGMEIALPDLDDEDTASIASPVRPFSGVGSFSFGRPASSSYTPGLEWPVGQDDHSPAEMRWSTFNLGSDKEEGLGFDLPLATSFSTPAVSSIEPIGMPSRPSLQRNLSVLAEVEEPEEEDEPVKAEICASPEMDVPSSVLESTHTTPKEAPRQQQAEPTPIVAPTPSRLRQLQLLSNHSSGSNAESTPSAHSSTGQGSQVTPGSPTKVYGTIGRGRPRPLALNSSASADTIEASNALSPVRMTPQNASRRGATRGGRSRGSSISYVRDESTSSSVSATASTAYPASSSSLSRDWSDGSSGDSKIKNAFSSQASVEWSPSLVGSPPLSFGRFSGWGNMPRSGPSRPCPRPKSIASLGADSKGAGRILGEVDEAEEDDLRCQVPPSAVDDDAPAVIRRSPRSFDPGLGLTGSHSTSLWPRSDIILGPNAGSSFSWRDPQLELEMERDALREDVDIWKARCQGLEERLELEKKEVVLLRERVRKLGDRLSAVQSSHPSSHSPARDSHDSSLLTEMRTQLFTLTAQLEQERREKQAAMSRAETLQSQLSTTHAKPSLLLQPVPRLPLAIVTPATPLDPKCPPLVPQTTNFTPFADPIARHVPSPAPTSPASSPVAAWTLPPLPIALPPVDPLNDMSESPLGSASDAHSPGDANLYRMRAWGFPSATKAASSSKSRRNRDSFFGLSNPLQRNSVDHGGGDQGLDLPPIDLSLAVGEAERDTERLDRGAGSQPSDSQVRESPRPRVPQSTSATSSVSSSVSFFSGYLPKFSSPPMGNRQDQNPSQHQQQQQRSMIMKGKDDVKPVAPPCISTAPQKLDFRPGCRCCVGEVMEL